VTSRLVRVVDRVDFSCGPSAFACRMQGGSDAATAWLRGDMLWIQRREAAKEEPQAPWNSGG
jgi:hypothetical protein